VVSAPSGNNGVCLYGGVGPAVRGVFMGLPCWPVQMVKRR
jgi:hypothetical protein